MPDEINWGDVGTLNHYASLLRQSAGPVCCASLLRQSAAPACCASLLRQITDSAFKEGEHAE